MITRPFIMQLTVVRARLVLAALLCVAGYGVINGRSVAPPPRDLATTIGDSQLQLRTIERIGRGEPYYAAVGDELRKHRYPTSPIVNFRTPLHYTAVAAMSVPRAGALLFTLCVVAVITAAFAYNRYSAAKATGAALLLLGSLGPAMLVRPGAVGYPEHWAAVFIALSLNAYVSRWFATGALLGITAVFVRELAAPYALASGLLAFRSRRGVESTLWLAGGVLYALYFGIHAANAAAAVQPGDLVREHSYLRWQGLQFVFMTVFMNGIFTILPSLATPVGTSAGLSAAWAESVPPHTKAAVLVYFALFFAIGQPFNSYWGYLTAPIWGHSLVHAPEGLRRLFRIAFGPRVHAVPQPG